MPDIFQSGCKINICLKIVGIRKDGYHLLDSLFWPLQNPHDTLEFEAQTDEQRLKVYCDTEGIDCNNNTLTKAYAAFIQAGGICTGAKVRLTKGIAHGAGLGGASGNAACVLKWCNKNASKKLSPQTLQEVALQVGADVPFFLQEKPARVMGIGEHIEPIDNFLKNMYALLVCPPIHISTPWAYAAFDAAQKKIFCTEDLTNFAHKDKHTFSCVAHKLSDYGNDFESAIFEHYPELAQIKKDLQKAQAELAVMSGSGSTMVGIFAKHDQAKQAAEKMQHKGYKVFISTL